jgi:hypothetical protein
MMARIEINLDVKCKRCGKKGATKNGMCLSCVTLAMERGEFDHIFDKHKRSNREKDDGE